MLDEPRTAPTPSRSLGDHLRDPVFWARYQFAHEGRPGAERLGDLDVVLDVDLYGVDDDTDAQYPDREVEFDVGGGHRLLLDVSVTDDSHDLAVRAAGAPDAALAWDDLVHWQPYALRWSELELICRAHAALNPDSAHPGAAMALLCRFVAVFDDDQVDQAVAEVDAAYASLRPDGWDGYWPTGADWLRRADFRGQGVTWHGSADTARWARQEDGHDLDFYSTRGEPSADGGFPHESLRSVLTAAAATVAGQRV